MTHIGPYSVVEKLGAGGMGEVYRARDSRLGRDVAIKVLTPALANDADYLARFQREAQVLASLNHPNIAAIYGLENNAIVMELVEGSELKGPLPPDEAIRIAKQIADALEAAHERGIVHRDLKPANIRITPDGTVKILDFGLAKAHEPAVAASASNSPTLTVHATTAGVILGTAAYMSPEQAAGKPVDRRADIWSFGVVLWEVLTGRQLFAGETVSHTLAAVLKDPVDLTPIPEGPLRTLAARCLDRDVRKRLGWIGEARTILDTPVAASNPRVQSSRLPWLVSALLLSIMSGLSWKLWQATRPPDRPLVLIVSDLGPGSRRTFAISPDGSRLFWNVFTDKGPEIWFRRMSDVKPAPLAGSQGITSFRISPDGEWLLGIQNRRLVRLAANGGTPEIVSDATGRMLGADWLPNGDIVSPLGSRRPLHRIPAQGGPPAPITDLEKTGGTGHRGPHVLPGGDAVLFTANTAANDNAIPNLYVVQLKSGAMREVVSNASNARYVGDGGRGYLLFLRGNSLYAQIFDASTLSVEGRAVAMVNNMALTLGQPTQPYQLTRDGMLVYPAGGTSTGWPIEWLHPDGSVTGMFPAKRPWVNPAFSPDGRKLAVQNDVTPADTEVWVYDLERGSATRIAHAGNHLEAPVWAPDGKHLVVFSRGAAIKERRLLWIRADGSGEPHILDNFEGHPRAFTPDGRMLILEDPMGNIHLLTLDVSRPDKPSAGERKRLVSTQASEGKPALSPDGKWLAYQSDESGAVEVYVRPLHGDGKWLVSVGGGSQPIWAAKGGALFYVSPDSRLQVVSYLSRNGAFEASRPRQWSEKLLGRFVDNNNLAAHPDGKRFAYAGGLASAPEELRELVFVLHFMDEVRRRLPL